MNNTYDFIICGGGFSGLTQAFYLSKYHKEKRILIIEPRRNPLEYITFSFWKDDSDLHVFDNLIAKKWKGIAYIGVGQEYINTLDNYSYCTIHGKDYGEYLYKELEKNKLITFVKDRVVSFDQNEEVVMVVTEKETYTAKTVFNSIFSKPRNTGKSHYLTQNIGGWIIETDNEVFDDNTMTMFDFSMGMAGWNFIYVLPFTKRKALIENIGLVHSSEELIKEYIEKHLGITNYHITYKEGGNTPMTDYHFPLFEGERIINIGKQGGMIKPTTGFAYTNAVKRCDWLALNANNLKYIHNNYEKVSSNRIYRIADSMMLHLMEKSPATVQKVFEKVFIKAKSDLLFKFLDERLSIKDTAKLMFRLLSVVPTFVRVLIEDVLSI